MPHILTSEEIAEQSGHRAMMLGAGAPRQQDRANIAYFIKAALWGVLLVLGVIALAGCTSAQNHLNAEIARINATRYDTLEEQGQDWRLICDDPRNTGATVNRFCNREPRS